MSTIAMFLFMMSERYLFDGLETIMISLNDTVAHVTTTQCLVSHVVDESQESL